MKQNRPAIQHSWFRLQEGHYPHEPSALNALSAFNASLVSGKCETDHQVPIAEEK
jgi:hypothetical protein